MKFKNTDVTLGMRFYTFVNDDEYFVWTVVKTTKSGVMLMNEETFEVKSFGKNKLEKEFILLIDYDVMTICNLRSKVKLNEVYESFWSKIDEIEKTRFFDTTLYRIACVFSIAFYPFMSKTVFYKLINYIIQYNFPSHKLLNTEQYDDLSILFDFYMNYNFNKYTILNCDDFVDEVDLSCIEQLLKIPDAIIDEAEIILNTSIKTYQCYEYDNSINLYNVNMKHFFMYYNDKYYIVIYIIDNIRDSEKIHENLQNHMDIVEFMLK